MESEIIKRLIIIPFCIQTNHQLKTFYGAIKELWPLQMMIRMEEALLQCLNLTFITENIFNKEDYLIEKTIGIYFLNKIKYWNQCVMM